jgi:hypothetical protein
MYDVVFVSNTSRIQRPYYDPSTRYRAFNAAHYLRRAGIKAITLTQVAFEENAEAFTSARAIVFHRPKFSEILARYITKYKKRQMLVCDYDDLVFDVQATNLTPAVCDRGEDPTQISRALASNAEMGAMFDHKSASTTPLAETARRCLGGEVLVIHNALDQSYVDVARAIRKSTAASKRTYDVGYFSGTASHNKDLRTIAPALADFLKQSSCHNFLLVGPVARPDELAPFDGQITKRAAVPFYEMVPLIASCGTVLGPLVMNTFTACKSGLKFFEAAPLGVRVAATPIPDIDRFTSPLLHKCSASEDWRRALLYSDPLDNRTMEQAAEAVCAEAALDTQMKVWINAFWVAK